MTQLIETALAAIGVTEYRTLDYLKTPEDLEAYVQERIRAALPALRVVEPVALKMADSSDFLDFLKSAASEDCQMDDWTRGYEECKRRLLRILGPQLATLTSAPPAESEAAPPAPAQPAEPTVPVPTVVAWSGGPAPYRFVRLRLDDTPTEYEYVPAAQPAQGGGVVATDPQSIKRALMLLARSDVVTDKDRIVIGAAIGLIATPAPAALDEPGAGGLPHISADENGCATLEWWNGDKKLTLYTVSSPYEALLKSWGGGAEFVSVLDAHTVRQAFQWLRAALAAQTGEPK